MDYKKSKAPSEIETLEVDKLRNSTGNIYKSLVICAKRANQISVSIKQELNQKLEEFASVTDNLEEIFDNREQIEISRFYEKIPKPTLLSIQEFLDGEIYFRKPESNDELNEPAE